MNDVTVVVPTKDRSALLRRALESVAAQEVQPSRVIVVDDASTIDPEPHIPEALASRTTVLRNPVSRNAAYSRNRGIDAAESQYVAFLDSDDYWEPNHLRLACATLRRQGADLVFGTFHSLEDGKRIGILPEPVPHVPVQVHDYLFGEHGIVRTSTIVGVTNFLRHVRFDDRLEKHQDWDLGIRAAFTGVVGFVDSPTVHIDHSPSCRMSRRSNPEASLYFLSKHEAVLTPAHRGAFFRRMVRGALRKGDLKALSLFRAEWSPAPWSGDAFVCRAAGLLARAPRLKAMVRRSGHWSKRVVRGTSGWRSAARQEQLQRKES